MQVIAKSKEGFLLEATELELKEIFQAVSRPVDEKTPIKIGDKIPAFDYAATIQKMREFKNSNTFKTWKDYGERVSESMQKMSTAIDSLIIE